MLARPNGREPAPDELRPHLYPGDVERDAVTRLLADHAVAEGEPLIALAPGSVWGTKRWPYYAELARAIASFGRPVVVGGADDAALAAAILAAVIRGGRHGAALTAGIRGVGETMPRHRDERLPAAASRVRDGHANRRAVRAHGTGFRVRPAVSPGRYRGAG